MGKRKGGEEATRRRPEECEVFFLGKERNELKAGD